MNQLFYKITVWIKMSITADSLVRRYRGKNINKGTVISIASQIEPSDSFIETFNQCLRTEFVYDPKLQNTIDLAKNTASDIIFSLKHEDRCNNVSNVLV